MAKQTENMKWKLLHTAGILGYIIPMMENIIEKDVDNERGTGITQSYRDHRDQLLVLWFW